MVLVERVNVLGLGRSGRREPSRERRVVRPRDVDVVRDACLAAEPAYEPGDDLDRQWCGDLGGKQGRRWGGVSSLMGVLYE